MRAQVVLTDMAISVIFGIFLLFFTHSMFLDKPHSLEYDAYLISEHLLKSQGIPNEWYAVNATMIGLSDGKGDLSPEKLSKLSQISPMRLKNYLNTKYDVSIYVNNDKVAGYSEGRKVIRFSRFAVLNGEVVNLGVVLSKP